MNNRGKHIKSFVIRAGRMSKLKERALYKLSDHFCIPFKDEKLNIESVFSKNQPLIVEIGFGMGDATAIIADTERDKNYIGIEVHKPGVAKLLNEIEKRELDNLKIINYDAVKVLQEMIPDDSVEGFFIFFPDPWPKKKHHKRRLIQKDFVSLLTSKLKKNGFIYSVTDWEDYAFQILNVLSESSEIVNPYSGFSQAQRWRPTTGFERKGLAKSHKIWEIFFRKEV